MIYSLPNRTLLVHNMIVPGSVGAEIGVFRGEFAHQLFEAKPAKVFLVDAWRQYDAYKTECRINDSNHEDNLAHVKILYAEELKTGRAEIVREWSPVAALNDSTPLDWFYLDSNHRYEFALVDLVAWSLRLKPGGVIMGHDYCTRPEESFGVIPAVTEFCERFGWYIECLTEEPVASYALRKK